ncbi:hypothetical protein [Reichenbachiella sp. MSK19-1]|uniref:hypothetical protein n=1 Tax=Reichenbachiella sp. MSK19-1 TaxID=1897631 RepID=UPI000E6CE193|nr:hypothetical protein [Reichenbachiella sp. MSK19-1]RJE75242.1 hypothetical protein BGP76_19270 [Reichenbachiella sp. MSK19-1]
MNLEVSKILSNYINKKLRADEFENWVYSFENLEIELGVELYTELISLDFKDKSNRIDVQRIFENKINYSDFHKGELLQLISKVCKRELPFKESIIQLYEWMNMGYLFLSKIDALANFNEQGKSIIHSIENTMTEEQKWETLLNREPNFFSELENIKTKIESGAITITGEYDNTDYYGKQFKFKEE